ncbi:hypothetical protein GQ44DRAFT_832362 [Phaeosphaeriaceae sp. PMI808]|nr:hypothetical protein GQ44DRAFT_832362 [Phaeosphaeriaceae sp. PMI808]
MRHFRDEDDHSVVIRERWYDLMEDNMSRYLTKGNDKLPALSGLARLYQKEFSTSRYLAGLWSGHLPYAPLWKTDKEHPQRIVERPYPYRAPSWSFLSLDGFITYESKRLIDEPNTHSDYGSRYHEITPMEVVDVVIQLLTPDNYSSIRSAVCIVETQEENDIAEDKAWRV